MGNTESEAEVLLRENPDEAERQPFVARPTAACDRGVLLAKGHGSRD